MLKNKLNVIKKLSKIGGNKSKQKQEEGFISKIANQRMYLKKIANKLIKNQEESNENKQINQNKKVY